MAVILEVTTENLRDIAAALHAARKREPGALILEQLESRVLRGLSTNLDALELDAQQAQALRNALLQRAWDQRSTSEGYDYSDLADRIGRALSDELPPLEDAVPDGGETPSS